MAFKVSSLQHHLVLDGPKLSSRTFCFEETSALCPLVARVHMGAHYTLTFLCTLSLIHTHTMGQGGPHGSSRGTSGPGPLTHTSSLLSLQMTATAQAPSKAQAVHLSTPSAAASTPVPTAPIDPQAQLEADKRAVYR